MCPGVGRRAEGGLERLAEWASGGNADRPRMLSCGHIARGGDLGSRDALPTTLVEFLLDARRSRSPLFPPPLRLALQIAEIDSALGSAVASCFAVIALIIGLLIVRADPP